MKVSNGKPDFIPIIIELENKQEVCALEMALQKVQMDSNEFETIIMSMHTKLINIM